MIFETVGNNLNQLSLFSMLSFDVSMFLQHSRFCFHCARPGAPAQPGSCSKPKLDRPLEPNFLPCIKR